MIWSSIIKGCAAMFLHFTHCRFRSLYGSGSRCCKTTASLPSSNRAGIGNSQARQNIAVRSFRSRNTAGFLDAFWLRQSIGRFSKKSGAKCPNISFDITCCKQDESSNAKKIIQIFDRNALFGTYYWYGHIFHQAVALRDPKLAGIG